MKMRQTAAVFVLFITVGVAGILVSCASPEKVNAPDPLDNIDWRSYGSDKASSKYVALDQIRAENVGDLQIAWRWVSVEKEVLDRNPELWSWAYEVTPVTIDGVLYTSTSLSQVAAIDARTGETLWSFDPESWKNDTPSKWFIHRGVEFWEGRVFIATGDAHLVALDAETGAPIEGFGENGRIDLVEGLRGSDRRDVYTMTSPPIVCGNVVVVGSSMSDFEPSTKMPVGDVRGFDAVSGEELWTFHSVPQRGETGVETWEDGAWSSTGNTNVWTLMSCDEELGYVYLPFGTPTNDFYGGHRGGDNLFGEALVALDAASGQRVWHFQIVHHGLWDYDLPAAPNLVDITVDGKEVKAVAQVTKQGFTFVFDRVTGEPVWPIEERPVPQSTVSGEKSSPTQPFPTKPPPFEPQGVAVDRLIDFTPELRSEGEAILEQYEYGPLYTPPTTRVTIVLPGWAGGASWAGAAFDPETETLYVPSILSPTAVKLMAPDPERSDMRLMGNVSMPGAPQGLPLFKPPYARLTAIDLSTGEHKWVATLGKGPVDHPALEGLDLPRVGWPRRSFPLATKTLLFVAQEGDRSSQRTPRGDVGGLKLTNVDASLMAFDPSDGSLIAEVPLPGNATGAPMSYMIDGKQYIVVAIGGASEPAELVALSLP